MATSFYSETELKEIGFKSVASNALISRKTSIYGAQNISIGENTRIDDFCILSGNITIGHNVHIAAYCGIFAGNTGVELHDFCGLSSRSVIYAESDDYSGEFMTNPTVSDRYLNIIKGKVVFERHVIIGTGSTILPGVTVHEGTAVGSMSLVNRSLDEWGVYVGIPCKRVKDRKRDLLELEKQFIAD